MQKNQVRIEIEKNQRIGCRLDQVNENLCVFVRMIRYLFRIDKVLELDIIVTNSAVGVVPGTPRKVKLALTGRDLSDKNLSEKNSV